MKEDKIYDGGQLPEVEIKPEKFTTHKINQKGIDIIKKCEGCKLESYLCPARVWTVGYGSTGKAIIEGLNITQERADELLHNDINYFETILNKYKLKINENQFSALISLIFNIGAGNFNTSTLLKFLKINPNTKDTIKLSEITGNVIKYIKNVSELNLIEYNFLRWCNAKNKGLKGLFNRRKDEYELYIS